MLKVNYMFQKRLKTDDFHGFSQVGMSVSLDVSEKTRTSVYIIIFNTLSRADDFHGFSQVRMSVSLGLEGIYAQESVYSFLIITKSI